MLLATVSPPRSRPTATSPRGKSPQIKHLEDTYGLSAGEAYMLCSLIGDLKIAEVVDLPHMLVTMHIPKKILAQRAK